MKKLKRNILISRNNKYQNTLWNLKIIKEYYKYKSLFIKKKYLKKSDLKILSIKDRNKNFITYNCLKKLYFKALKKNDMDLIYKFYKKYSSNLILKKKYDGRLKKVSNQNTNLETYLYLGFLIMKLKLNNIMKLNTILKINDHIFLQLNKLKNEQNKFLFSKLLILEIKLLKKILIKWNLA